MWYVFNIIGTINGKVPMYIQMYISRICNGTVIGTVPYKKLHEFMM